MPRRPAAYLPAYREQIIALARAGRTSKELEKSSSRPSKQSGIGSFKPRRIAATARACTRRTSARS